MPFLTQTWQKKKHETKQWKDHSENYCNELFLIFMHFPQKRLRKNKRTRDNKKKTYLRSNTKPKLRDFRDFSFWTKTRPLKSERSKNLRIAGARAGLGHFADPGLFVRNNCFCFSGGVTPNLVWRPGRLQDVVVNISSALSKFNSSPLKSNFLKRKGSSSNHQSSGARC